MKVFIEISREDQFFSNYRPQRYCRLFPFYVLRFLRFLLEIALFSRIEAYLLEL